MTVEDDGSVCVKTGTQDIGTGTRTVIAQLAAEGLALPIERVRVELGDTASGLEAPTSAGSATLPTVGSAVSEAARALEATLLAFTAERLGVDAAALELTDGAVGPRDDPDAGLTLAELARLYAPRPLSSWGTCESAPDDVVVRTFAACAADVTIDSETGELTVQRLICAPDCGRVVNPILATSQVVGGVTQALGFALTEQRIVDRARGRVLNANLEDYLVPTVADVPEIEHAFVDLPDPHVNTLGVKGLGEPPLIAVAPAIANAVFDAVGVRIRNLPINRKRLLEALAGSTPEAS
jgi:xanthine dehydrogenase YagR molybdenum-binding subunit